MKKYVTKTNKEFKKFANIVKSNYFEKFGYTVVVCHPTHIKIVNEPLGTYYVFTPKDNGIIDGEGGHYIPKSVSTCEEMIIYLAKRFNRYVRATFWSLKESIDQNSLKFHLMRNEINPEFKVEKQDTHSVFIMSYDYVTQYWWCRSENSDSGLALKNKNVKNLINILMV